MERPVCCPDLLCDGQAREVARRLTDDPHIGDECVAPLAEAVEAYDLATARVLWCRACQTDEVHEQGDALRWHEQEQRRAYLDMVFTLQRAIA